ncbi:MAG TPA: DUF1540 domain-containing protein [Polyangiaceae bacterium]
MRLKIDLPIVSECSVTTCVYNSAQRCHAKAITVGDGDHPACDTFMASGAHARSATQAGVGACKVSSCKHNQDFECTAERVQIGNHQDHADCLTFEPN